MKIVLIIVLIGCCTYIGYGFSKYYTLRNVFFADMTLLMDKLKLDIKFSKEKVGDIVKNFNPFSKHFKLLCDNFVGILEVGKFDEQQLFDGINFLKLEEKNTLQAFFKSLGRFDIENQTNQINSFLEEVKKYQISASADKDKYSSLFIKIGFIIGVLIALIIV